MPWKIADVSSHISGLDDKQQHAWVGIANAALSQCIKAGGTDKTCAPKAIRTANAMAKRIKEGKVNAMGVDMMIQSPELIIEAEEAKRQERFTMKEKIVAMIGQLGELVGLESTIQDGPVRKKIHESIGTLSNLLKDINDGGDIEKAEPVLSECAILIESAKPKDTEPEELSETEVLPEAVKPDKGVLYARAIKPGWGTSGYYSEGLLKEASNKYAVGTQCFWNHPSKAEVKDRPEGNLHDLAGVIVKEGEFIDGPLGAGVYVGIKAFSGYAEAIKEFAPYIGMSHVAFGKRRQGEADGKAGPIIESIDHVQRLDFVTREGAGGKVVGFMESALQKAENWDNINEEQEVKQMEEVKELQEKVTALEAERDELKKNQEAYQAKEDELKTLKESIEKAKVKGLVSAQLKDSGLPEKAADRIGAQEFTAVYTEAGELDEEETKKAIVEAITKEKEYIASLSESGSIKGMGAKKEEGGNLKERFTARYIAQGYSEEEAKRMAESSI